MLRTRRAELGLSLERVARRAGTSTATLCRYEKGWTRFEVATLHKLASALGCRLTVELHPPQVHAARHDVARLRRLFWDKPFDARDISRFPRWVVTRVVHYGDIGDIHALVDRIGLDGFLDIVATVRFSSKKAFVFWNKILEIEGMECTKSRFPQEAGTSFLP